MGHIYLFHSHPIAIYACPIPSHGTFPMGFSQESQSHGQPCISVIIPGSTTFRSPCRTIVLYSCKLQFGEVARHSGYTNSTDGHFVAECHTVKSSEKSHLCRLQLGLYSFGHYPRFMTIGSDRNNN